MSEPASILTRAIDPQHEHVTGGLVAAECRGGCETAPNSRDRIDRMAVRVRLDAGQPDSGRGVLHATARSLSKSSPTTGAVPVDLILVASASSSPRPGRRAPFRCSSGFAARSRVSGRSREPVARGPLLCCRSRPSPWPNRSSDPRRRQPRPLQCPRLPKRGGPDARPQSPGESRRLGGVAVSMGRI
jgi:hypothetical protein